MLEEFSRNINRQSAPKYVGLTMACRYFGIVQQSRLKAALEKFSPLAEADILAATNDRELRFPKKIRIRPRTGETFNVSNDLSTLKIMLQTARQSLDAKTAKGRAVAKESSSCFWDSVRAYKSWAALLPSHLQLGGSYVLPHVLRKHALAWHMQRWQSPSAEAFIAHLFELDGRMHEQPQISTMDAVGDLAGPASHPEQDASAPDPDQVEQTPWMPLDSASMFCVFVARGLRQTLKGVRNLPGKSQVVGGSSCRIYKSQRLRSLSICACEARSIVSC